MISDNHIVTLPYTDFLGRIPVNTAKGTWKVIEKFYINGFLLKKQ